jgi:hypothetical protein
MVNSSGDAAKDTDAGAARMIQRLRRLTAIDLKLKYRELFGEDARISHKEYLVRRIAWQLQAKTERDVGDQARQRIACIADFRDISPNAPWALQRPAPPSSASLPIANYSEVFRDPRLPPVGAELRRQYQGRQIVVQVVEDGFQYESRHYRSLSAVARHITSVRWNGFLFFGLTERIRYV